MMGPGPHAVNQQAMLMAQLQELLGGGGQQGAPEDDQFAAIMERAQEPVNAPQIPIPQTASPFQRLMAAMGAGAGAAGTPMQQQTSQQLLGMVRGQDQRAIEAQNQNVMMDYQAQRANRMADVGMAQSLMRAKSGNAMDRLLMSHLLMQERSGAAASRRVKEEGVKDVREYIEDLSTRYPEAGIMEGDSKSDARAKASEYITAENRQRRAQLDLLLQTMEENIFQRKGTTSAFNTISPQAKSVSDQLMGLAKSADEIFMHDVADQARSQMQALVDGISSINPERVTAAEVSVVRGSLSQAQSFANKWQTRIAKNRKLLTTEAKADLGKWFEVEQLAGELLPLYQSYGRFRAPGGPVAGQNLFYAQDIFGTEYRDVNDKLTRLRALTAFSEGGKNLTGVELTVVGPKIPYITDTYSKTLSNLQGILRESERALKRAESNTGMTRDQLESLAGMAIEDLEF